MQFCSAISFLDPHHFTEMARTADAAGWDWLGISDHVVFPCDLRSAYPYSPDGKPGFDGATPWADPWVTIGAMSAVTERLRFLTNVYVLALRHPVEVAKTLGTAAYLSRGRVALGVGVGWIREEFDILGEDFRTRGRRTDEAIEVMRALWSGEPVEHHGRFYELPRVQMSPAPPGHIPIFAGGTSEAALRRAARNDGWISVLHSFEELEQLIGKLTGFRKELGREDEPFEIAVSCTEAYDLDGYRRLEEMGATTLVTMPWLLYGGSNESLEDKCEGLRRFAGDVIEKLR